MDPKHFLMLSVAQEQHSRAPKSQNDSKNYVKSKVRIEGNIENSCSTTWVEPKKSRKNQDLGQVIIEASTENKSFLGFMIRPQNSF